MTNTGLLARLVVILGTLHFVVGDDSASNIVGGKVPDREEAAWAVAINSIGYVCSGSIVGRRWILTSASCLQYSVDNPGVVRMLIGAHNLDTDVPDGQITTGKKIILHPGYNSTDWMWDNLALIKTTDVMRVGSRVISALDQLPTPEISNTIQQKDRRCFLYGRGRTKDDEGVWVWNREMKRLSLRYIKCKNDFEIFKDTNVDCMRTNMRDDSPCGGDFGAAMVCRFQGKWYQTGMYHAMGSADGCLTGFGSVTNIAAYRDWILDNID